MDDIAGLLTEEAKIMRIKKILPSHSMRGSFFTPDDAFYQIPRDNDGLKSMSKEISKWIGFKPVGLKVTFTRDISDDSCFVVSDDGPAILIHGRHAKNPFACTGLLAEGLIEYYLEYRKHLKIDDSEEQKTLVMLGVVYSGLGLLALNYTTSYWQEHYPKLYYLFHHSRDIGKAAARYTAYVSRFALDYGIELGPFAKYLCPWAQILLPSKWQHISNRLDYVKSARHRSRRAYLALIVSLFIVITGTITSSYIVSRRLPTLPRDLREERSEIDILKDSYDACNASVAKKQKQYDQTDFFIVRNIEADKERCLSIRNKYNYRVEDFNTRSAPYLRKQ